MTWMFLALGCVPLYCLGGGIAEGLGSKHAFWWPFLLFAWLWRVLIVSTYRHLIGREARRRAYRMDHHQQCARIARKWQEDAEEFDAAGYPLSAAVTANAAELFDALSQSFFDDANPQTAGLVLPVSERNAA